MNNSLLNIINADHCSKVINSHGAILLTNLDATFKHVRK